MSLRLTLAWLGSLAPLCLAALPEDPARLAGIGLSGLVVLPWLALAGLPGCAAQVTRERPIRQALLWPCAALGPLVLAARADVSAGWPPAYLGVALVLGALSMAALEQAAGRALHSARSQRLHALAWLVLVPGAALLAAVLRWAPAAEPPLGAAPSAASRVLDALAQASPLRAALDLARTPEPVDAPLAPLAAIAALCALASLAGSWPSASRSRSAL